MEEEACPICLEAPQERFFFGCRHSICAACKERLSLRDMDTVCPLCRHDDLPLTGTFAAMARIGMRRQAVSLRKKGEFEPEATIVLSVPGGLVIGIDGRTEEVYRFQTARRYDEDRERDRDASAGMEEARHLQERVGGLMSLNAQARRLVFDTLAPHSGRGAWHGGRHDQL